MKALTLTQPWATLVAIGAKRIETRSWRTSYRGPLAIHAAKGFPKWAREFAQDDWTCFGALKPGHAAHLKLSGVRLIPSETGRRAAGELPIGAVVAVRDPLTAFRWNPSAVYRACSMITPNWIHRRSGHSATTLLGAGRGLLKT